MVVGGDDSVDVLLRGLGVVFTGSSGGGGIDGTSISSVLIKVWDSFKCDYGDSLRV